MSYVIEPPVQPNVNVAGGGLFPVRRIFCIGRNYADHVREMGGDPKANQPVFFTKPADAVVANGSAIPYAMATQNLHYEGELVVALKSGGANIPAGKVRDAIFGFAAGCDLTRRDHQAHAKEAGAPWDTAKGFDHSAPVGEIVPVEAAGQLSERSLVTFINGEKRQDAPLSSMIWSVDEIIAALSGQFELKAGDLIFTGTPEGVGPLVTGDAVKVEIGPLSVAFNITAADAKR
ncbi:fumarylacetoacetate hydrolase family protein [Hyphococcus sp.]|uniref:fumarylacetoacetate hydrolase family protein n=1 Tax=Hyphococcus sp. TaxID=2038636 RepID=UPI00208C282B|nr:MAG: fumarylacetoacetate hydrolase [Marinicaulis sp.]